jgi:lipopolysaccharide heptosyltransferase II
MTLWTMRRIDLWVGKLLCLILQPFNWLRKRVNIEKVGKILIIKFWGVGSIIETTPAIKLLRQRYPEVRIDFLTFHQNKGICELIPELDNVLVLRLEKNFTPFILNVLKLLIKIRKMKYDILFDFEFFTRFSAIFSFLAGAKKRVGFHAWDIWRGNFHDVNIPFNYYWHVSENFINAAVGVTTINQIYHPEIKTPSDETIKNLLQEYEINKSDNIIGINVNAGPLGLQRRWPKEKFVSLIDRIANLSNKVKIVLIGAEDERHYVGEIINATNSLNKIINLAGKLDLKQLVSFISKVRLFISNDAGPLHIAYALDISTISFFGPETPVIYGPRGNRHKVFFKNISCSPCIHVYDQKTGRCRYNEPKCLQAIEVDEVFEAVKKEINK